MADWSVRNVNAGPQRSADALLRAAGGYTAEFMIAPAVGDATDAGELGIDGPNFQTLQIAPVAFRKTRPTTQENEPARYELLVSASAIAQQVSLLALNSAEALFDMVASIQVAGLSLLMEEWACSASLGAPLIYRMVLRTAQTASLSSES